MIVTCPTCRNKYSVQAEAIGESKMVRCAACNTVWRQLASEAVDEDGKHRVRHVIKWTFFWFATSITLFSIFFARNCIVKVWPPMVELYNFLNINQVDQKKLFLVQNISNFFVRKEDKLYMGLKGELTNISNSVQVLPSVTISLRDDGTGVEKKGKSCYKRVWTHDMMYKKILPNQTVVFETELQSVPCHNLICDVKLDIL
jgi:predicted Zn finger-like uncharacterized protein